MDEILVKIYTCEQCEDVKKAIINNEIVLEGDYYHNKISDRIEGFIYGLKYCGHNVAINEYEFICDDCKCDYDD